MQRIKLLLPALTIVLLTAFAASAQLPQDYKRIMKAQDPPRLYYEQLVINYEDSLSIFVPYRVENDFLTFREEGDSYIANVKLFLNLFKPKSGSKDDLVLQRSDVQRKIQRERLFENTQSRKLGPAGFFEMYVDSGRYNIMIRVNDESVDRELSSDRHTLNAIPLTDSTAYVYLTEADTSATITGSMTVPYLNYGGQFRYGHDLGFWIVLPQTINAESLQLDLQEISTTGNDTTVKRSWISTSLRDQAHYNHASITPRMHNSKVHLTTNNHPTLQSVWIDASGKKLPNSTFRLRITDTSTNQSLFEQTYRSYWPNIPAPLLSLDFSIRTMEPIMEPKQFEKWSTLDREGKIKSFQEFWKQRDPTPDTHINELMNEYFTRVEKTIKEYTTPRKAGYETDRGRTLILKGEPDSRNRSFPSTNVVIETWVYPNETIRFKSSGGYDDFRKIKS